MPITDPDLARLMALAEPSRWAMVRLLAERPRNVGEVAHAVGLSLAVTSRHLQRLRAVGLVEAVRDGKTLSCALPAPETPGGRWLASLLGLHGAPPRSGRAAPPVPRPEPAPVGAAAAAAAAPARRAARPAPAPPARREMDDFLL
jgi:DNA-binding transcriptional ArsR family regulator